MMETMYGPGGSRRRRGAEIEQLGRLLRAGMEEIRKQWIVTQPPRHVLAGEQQIREAQIELPPLQDGNEADPAEQRGERPPVVSRCRQNAAAVRAAARARQANRPCR